jgi:heme/copper-type cytochrome/quinol oxidase subunit 2
MSTATNPFDAGTMAGVAFDASMLSTPNKPLPEEYWGTVFWGYAIGTVFGVVVVLLLSAVVPWIRNRNHETLPNWSARQIIVLVARLVVIEWFLWTLITWKLTSLLQNVDPIKKWLWFMGDFALAFTAACSVLALGEPVFKALCLFRACGETAAGIAPHAGEGQPSESDGGSG